MIDTVTLNIGALTLIAAAISILRFLHHERGGLRLTPPAFLGAACIVLIIAAMLTAALGPMKAALGFALGLGGLVSFFHPVAATSFFTALLIVRPWELTPPNPVTALLPRTFASLCLIIWFGYALRQNRLKLHWSRGLTLFISLVFWILIASCATGNVGDVFSKHLESFFPILVLVLLIVNALHEWKDLRCIARSIAIAATGATGVALYTTVTFPMEKYEGRLHGPGLFGNANDMGALITLAIPLLIAAYFTKRDRLPAKLFATGMLAILLLGLSWSQSRASLIALGLAGAAYFMFSKARAMTKLSALLAAIVLSAALFATMSRESEDLEGSRTSRWNFVVAGLRMTKAYPLFGVGMGNYPRNYERFTPSFEEYGPRTAHSSWILILSETGIFGFALFVWLFALAAASAWRLRSTHAELLLSLITYGFCMSFLSHAYLFTPYLVIALILAGRKISRQVEQAAEASP